MSSASPFKKNAAYPKAIADLKAAGLLSKSVERKDLINYLNILVEQDRRFIKRLIKAEMGFFSPETAERTEHRYEVMHMIRNGQVTGAGKGDLSGQVAFIVRLFAVAA